ncbi:EAL domain-containing protein [Photobacterium chitinilyticum]|uniref:EAL domain-containing protein n=1 Tax=Photobacterium chitinilyticum TaxID=2485123 RepID=A0A3S3R1M3_9GAMM|nr:EAL domain-containing protein [Photobacterium chitinilyticum]RWX55846.1 EAL domain-containing protein [Photobacterium chitinilyticum]
MNHASLLALTHNATLLLAMIFIYDMATSRSRNSFDSLWKVFMGFALGLIGAVIMLTPWEYSPGIIFDTRSVLLGISGLFFGPIPTIIAMVMTATLRLYQGGEAAITGVTVIIASGALGIAWHYYRRRPLSDLSAREIYLFGIIVHMTMLALMFTLPWGLALKVLSNITFPVLLIYPLITVAMGMLFVRRLQRDKTAEALKESEFLFRSQFDLGNIGIAITHPDKNWLRANPRLCEILGYSEDKLLQLTWQELSHPDDLQLDLDQFDRMIAGEIDGYSLDKRFIRKGGDIVYVHVTIACYRVKGQVQFAIAGILDITERKLAEESLQLASMVYQNSSEAMVVTDSDGEIITTNPAFTEITGYSQNDVKGKSPKLLLSRHQNDNVIQDMLRALNNNGHWQGEIQKCHKSGKAYTALLTVNSIYNSDGTTHRRVAQFSDISDKKKSDEIIWTQANFDALTGLPNRHMFLNQLEQEKRKAHRANRPMALLFLDLDHFKEVNDTLGHNIGDQLLVDVAQRLRNCVRDTDTVSRLGGDEFTVILSEQDDTHSAERIAQEILYQFSAPFTLGVETIYISPSIGITLYPEDGTKADTLLKNADQAMYAAKEQGRNCYRYFTTSMQEKALYRRQLANELRLALNSNQLQLHYQPIVELATGNMAKAEALIRWQHPVLGMISPVEFVPVAEETGIIIELGDWVFHQAARQAAQWRKLNHPDFQISINKSPQQFRDKGNDISQWLDHLRSLGLPGQAIAVEITEGLLLDASTTVTDKLLEFRDAGIEVSLDDFGTGYSSLSYIKKFHVDNIKIDQSFVRNLKPDSEDLAVCEAIIVMAHKLGLKVVAEGIETNEQRALLAAAGCDYGQGNLFSMPLPVEKFKTLLSSQEMVI